jgi:nicotinate phosphoribosyltransferase
MDRTIEQRYADLLRGGEDNSPLATDGYKFPMGQAGFPLRHEYFYLHFRRGGAQFIPFDFKAVMEALQPRLPNSREQGFLLANGYGMTPAMQAALQGELHVMAQPKGTWVNEKEPVLVPSGPSFLVSWYESLCIAFNFPMQIATAILEGQRQFKASCRDEKEIIKLVAEALAPDIYALRDDLYVEVCEDEFRVNIRTNLERLRHVLGGDIDRAFEVGTRAMTCMAQHRIVLEECKAAGIQRTANVKLAYDLYMIPVGTTGHEHQERHGADINGFRAIRDQRPEPPSYLFDTYDPMKSGIPSAISAMLEDRQRRCSVRFDSGDQEKQLRKFVVARLSHCLDLFYIFMDGYDDERISKMELACDKLGVPYADRHYGLGSYLVSKTALTEYTRDCLAMVYKLCQSGGPGYDGEHGARNVKKYSGSPGKESIAGRPIVVVARDGTRYIAQQGEGLQPEGGIRRDERSLPKPTKASILSPATEAISEACRVRDLPWEDI